MVERRDVYQFFDGESSGKEPIWETQGVKGRTIIRQIFRTWIVGAWTGLIWLRIGTVGGNL
jgi:hypothetical protein